MLLLAQRLKPGDKPPPPPEAGHVLRPSGGMRRPGLQVGPMPISYFSKIKTGILLLSHITLTKKEKITSSSPESPTGSAPIMILQRLEITSKKLSEPTPPKVIQHVHSQNSTVTDILRAPLLQLLLVVRGRQD